VAPRHLPRRGAARDPESGERWLGDRHGRADRKARTGLAAALAGSTVLALVALLLLIVLVWLLA
jgi:hypothetical protein